MPAIQLDTRHFKLPPERTDAEWSALRNYDLLQLWEPTRQPNMASSYRIRMETLANAVASRLQPGARVLDVGCAQGTLGLLLAAHGFKVTLLELRPTCIEYARARHVAGEVQYFSGFLSESNPPDSNYDLVLCTEVIEHVTRPSELLNALAAKCRPGGLLALTTPNADYLLSRLPSFGGAQQAVIDTTESNTDDGDDHRFLYTREELAAVLRAMGLRVVHHAYMIPVWQEGHRKLLPAHRLYRRALGDGAKLPEDLSALPDAVQRRLCSSQLVIAQKPE